MSVKTIREGCMLKIIRIKVLSKADSVKLRKRFLLTMQIRSNRMKTSSKLENELVPKRAFQIRFNMDRGKFDYR